MELRHLRYLVAVAEEENITRAAARLHVSQPPLSRQIRDLEEELGLELFRRSPKSIRLTAAGKVFLEEARAVLERVEEALATARTLSGADSDELHVGYAPSLTVKILPETLRHFQAACPKTRVRLHDLSTEEMLARLREESLDVALMIKPARSSLSGLAFVKLAENAVFVATHPEHPLARRKTVSLEQVARHPLIAYAQSDYPEYHAWLSRLFAKQGLEPNIAEQHDGSASLIASVESGRGVALVQAGFDRLSGSRLALRPLSPAPAPFVVGLAHRQGDPRDTTAHFLAAAKNHKS